MMIACLSCMWYLPGYLCDGLCLCRGMFGLSGVMPPPPPFLKSSQSVHCLLSAPKWGSVGEFAASDPIKTTSSASLTSKPGTLVLTNANSFQHASAWGRDARPYRWLRDVLLLLFALSPIVQTLARIFSFYHHP